jgi:hypothetical protein
MSALPPFERWRPARFTLFLKLNARFSLPMSSIALNSRDGKDHRLSRHRHHRRVRIRLLAIGTDEAQMTISMPAANSQRSSTSQARAGNLCQVAEVSYISLIPTSADLNAAPLSHPE